LLSGFPVADVFGTSRTGIRKVLQRLALEQLVTLTPWWGASRFMERHLKSIGSSLSIFEEPEEPPDLRDIFAVNA